MFTNRPAMKFCFPLILGIILGWYFPFPFSTVFTGMLGFLFLFFILRLLKVKQSNTFLLFVLILLFGIFKITSDTKDFLNQKIKSRSNIFRDGVLVRGTITDRAMVKKDRVVFIIEAESIHVGSQTNVMEGGVIANIWRSEISDDAINNLEYGKVVWLKGDLHSLQEPRNPHEFDYRQYLLLNDIYSRLIIRSEKDITINEHRGNWMLATFVYPVREWISRILDVFVGGEEAKILKGLVIGERSEMAPEVKAAFINAGLMHILAVSGFNVGLVTVIFWTIFSIFRLPNNVRAIITSIALIWFMYLTGAQPPVVRAVIMAIIIIGAKALELKSDLYNTVAIAAMIFLLVDAKGLFDVGFQLSFAAVLSLAYLYPKISSLSNNLFPRLQNNLIIKYLVASIAVSVAATLGTLPLTAYYFNKVSLIGIGLNLIAVPLSGIILALGFTVSAMTAISTWLGSVFAEVASLLSSILLTLTTWGGNLSFAFIPIRINALTVIGLFIGIIALFECHRKVVRKWTLILSLVVLNALIYWRIFSDEPETLRVTFLDVGQGDAIFLEFPNGGNMLVDAGPRTFGTDAGSRFIVPYLRYKGISRIQTLSTSHPDADHLGGVPAILRQFKVNQVIDAGSVSSSSLFNEYIHLIDSLHLQRLSLQSGMRIGSSNDIRLYVLHPSTEFLQQKSRTTLNNQSLVVKVVYGKTSLLLAGDTEEEAEIDIESKYDSFLKSDILKISHHGSITGTSDLFLKSVRPQTAIISVGAKNKFNHPSPVVLQRIMELGCKYYRTDELGAIVLESDGERWNWIDWR